MRKFARKGLISFTTCIICAVLVSACSDLGRRDIPPGAVSEFGRYEKYSEPVYDEWIRTSEYVTMRDGVKLAVDIIRPAVNGITVEEPLPAV